jgi:hypothetical protein
MQTCAAVDQPAPAFTAASRPVPLFVFGVARSGTTFTAYLLNRHPRILCAREARVFHEGLYEYERCRNHQDRAEFRELLRRLARCDEGARSHPWLAETLKSNIDELYRRHQARPSFATLIEAAFELARPGLTCFANKFIRPELCPLMLQYWPHAKVVLLLRDPRAAYASQRRFFKMRLKYAAIYWNLHARYALAQRDDAARSLLVRYEDLMRSPVDQLARILRFANQWEPSLPESIVRAVPPRSATLEKWRDALSPAEVKRLEEYCYDGMRALGYMPEHARRPRHIGSVGRAVETVRQYAGQVPLRVDTWRRQRLGARFLQMVGLKRIGR